MRNNPVFRMYNSNAVLDCCFNSMVKIFVLSATFNNISVISWWSVALVAETGVPGENYRSPASHTCLKVIQIFTCSFNNWCFFLTIN